MRSWLHCHFVFFWIKNLRWQLGGEITQVTFRKSATSFVQKLKKILNKLHCATGYWLPCSLFKIFLKFLDQQCWRFSEGYLNNFSTELSPKIFDCCPRNFLIQEERISNVVSTSHWIQPVIRRILLAINIKMIQNDTELMLKCNWFLCEKLYSTLCSQSKPVHQYLDTNYFQEESQTLKITKWRCRK